MIPARGNKIIIKIQTENKISTHLIDISIYTRLNNR